MIDTQPRADDFVIINGNPIAPTPSGTIKAPKSVAAEKLTRPLMGKITRPIKRSRPKIGRNKPCPCGSGRKFKTCHGRTPNHANAETTSTN